MIALPIAALLLLAPAGASGQCEQEFRRGDANADGDVDISDGIATLAFLFLGEGAPPCRAAADANDSGVLDLSDAVFTFSFLFTGGLPPPAPGHLECGLDPTADGLGCLSYPPCPLAVGEEACNGLDDDCDGEIDEGCECLDGQVRPCGSDVGECRQGVQTCLGGRWGPCVGEIGPAPEACDGLDNDCNGASDDPAVPCPCDDGAVRPCGSDVGDCRQGVQTCLEGEWGPCEGEMGPAPEACDGLDNDCNGVVDDRAPPCECVEGQVRPCGSGAGECRQGVQTCFEGSWGACEGAVGPTAEVCDGLDNDCDGVADNGFDLDGDGWTVCGGDCDDASPSVNPGVPRDWPNGIDDDCDGEIDEGPFTIDYSRDIQPIWTASCAQAGCHSGSFPANNMRLNAGASHGSVVNVPSLDVPEMDRVEPGSPQRSYLWHKINGTHLSVGGSGSSMPSGSPLLPLDLRRRIELWIQEGARP